MGIETRERIGGEGVEGHRNGHSPTPISGAWRLASAAALACTAALIYATQIEATWLEVTRRELALPRLPAAFDGLRIAHLSDFHLSSIVPYDYLTSCIRAAMAEQPDLVLMTGDFVSRKPRETVDLTPLLRPLSAPLGVYGALGNHDAVVGADAVAAAVEAAGATVLRNRHVCLRRGGDELWLAGIDYPDHAQYRVKDRKRSTLAQRFRRLLDAALGGIPSDGFRLLLAHSPDVVRDAARLGVDLMLSGHTHGGQVRFPLVGATVVPSRYGHRYSAGEFRVEETTLYVSRGLGTVRFPIRFLCRPELGILTLRQQPVEGLVTHQA